MASSPRISVVLLTKNGGSLLRESLAAVPSSAFVAEGSPVSVYRGKPIPH